MIEHSLPGPGIRTWTALLIGVLLGTADAAGEATDGAGQRRAEHGTDSGAHPNRQQDPSIARRQVQAVRNP